MKNDALLNICYKFFNRFITANQLIEMLSSVNKEMLQKEEVKQFNELIKDIKNIVESIPNVEDEYVIKKKESIKGMINTLESISKDVTEIDMINKGLNDLREDYDNEIDSHERWFAVTDYINCNDYFNACFDNLSDYELLEFIAQYISAPFPPQINQEQFESLVKVGIENEKKEWLWRLAFNYERKNIDFTSIANYFIDIKDGYYLAELISAVGNDLDIDEIIDKIFDKELIDDLKNRKSVMEVNVTEEQFTRLFSK